ncbi:MAG: hypothetical protein QOG05_6080 [Streptosporangiaceae bacterium]|nr:hypothetical protein [Streptosporangiaceae bacterium]
MIFGRESTTTSEALATPFGEAPAKAVPQAPLSCTEGKCLSGAATHCSYVDRRQRECGTAWCLVHQQIVFGKVLCRRHARIVTAVGPMWHSRVLPDLENRAPSLANWVCSQLDGPIRALLARNFGSQTLSVSAVGIGVSRRDRMWGTAWKVVSPQGIDLSINAIVSEADPNTVLVMYDGLLFRELAAPWIEAHQTGSALDSVTDVAAQQRFVAGILEDLEVAVLNTKRTPWRPAAGRSSASTASAGAAEYDLGFRAMARAR